MGHVVECGESVGHRVVDAEADVGEAHSGDVLAKGHSGAAGGLVGDGVAERGGDEADRLDVHHVRHRAGGLRYVALDRVGKRVHAGKRRKPLGHRRHHVGIDEGDDGDVVGIDADELALLLDIGDDVVDRNLGGCSGGSGNREDRLGGFGRRRDALEGADVSELRVGDDDADGLGGIHRRAAADGDDRVGLGLPEGLDAVLHVVDRRVRLYVAVDGIGDLSLVQKVGDLLRDAELDEVGVGEHYRLLESARGELAGYGANRTSTVVRSFVEYYSVDHN